MAYLEQKILWRFNGGKEDWFLLCLFLLFFFHFWTLLLSTHSFLSILAADEERVGGYKASARHYITLRINHVSM